MTDNAPLKDDKIMCPKCQRLVATRSGKISRHQPVEPSSVPSSLRYIKSDRPSREPCEASGKTVHEILVHDLSVAIEVLEMKRDALSEDIKKLDELIQQKKLEKYAVQDTQRTSNGEKQR